MMRRASVAVLPWVLVGIAVLLGAAGCGNHHGDLLVVYTGDCQGYLDPCG
jgi:hypothetical protein